MRIPNMPTKELIEIISKGIIDINSILVNVKKETKADDVRFRVKDWRDESIVYVSKWVIGSELDDVEPVLAQRFYYDKKKTNRYPFDCFVGLRALIARLDEEESKNKDKNLIKKIKKLLIDIKESVISIKGFEEFCSQDLNTKAIFQKFFKKLRNNFYFQDLGEQKIFKEFVNELENKSKKWNEKKGKWEELLAGQSNLKELQSKLNELKDHWKEKGVNETEKLNEFSKLYRTITENYKSYIGLTKKLWEEIAVEVVAFGRFIGVLNLHKYEDNSQAFTAKDIEIARNYAGKLAVACIEREMEQFNQFQELSRVISAESNFRKIATKISELIRDVVLRDGLEKDKVFPLLYIPVEAIAREENLNEGQFEERWKNSYYAREKEKKENGNDLLLEDENRLGNVHIRGNGLGRKVIDNWRGGSYRLFIDEIHVDDLFESQGSLSALSEGVKTTGCLPLVYGDKVYGLLYLHCKKRHFFTDMEVRALEMLANQAAIAIKNAKIFGKSYEELFGNRLLEELRSLSEKYEGSWQNKEFNEYKEIWEILNNWADDIESVRGEEAIADITKDNAVCDFLLSENK